MFGKVSRYDEHPTRLEVYRQVIGRSSTPQNLPLSSEETGLSPWRVIFPMFVLFVLVTESCALLAPTMFLGWLIHGLCFTILGGIVYHLCPPQWTERVEVNEREVFFELLGLTGYHVEKVPLVQYRGIIPITHTCTTPDGVIYKEYGVALRHADPTKTIILALSPIYNEQILKHFAQLLKVKILREKKFALHLQSKKSIVQRVTNERDQSLA